MLRFKKLVKAHLGLQDFHVLKRNIHRKNSYYEMLGVTPKATQADIKKAFYQLSMQFHPDKGGDDVKFREISAAYEVLGNLKLRRMYDRGYFPEGASTTVYENMRDNPAPTNDGPIDFNDFREQFARKAREEEKKWTPPNGRTDAFDYDEWTRKHYADAFMRNNRPYQRRHQEYQDWVEFKFRQNYYHKQQREAEKSILVIFALIFITILCTSSVSVGNFDQPVRKVRTLPPQED